VQQLIDRLTAAASKPNGEMVSATQHDIAEVILQRAKALDVASSRSVTSTIAGAGNLLPASIAERRFLLRAAS